MTMILNDQLKQDSFSIVDLPLSNLRLLNDARYPWLLLIPRVPDVSEIYNLDEQAQLLLTREIAQSSEILTDLFMPTKINVAALGNIVPQLHIHVIARFDSDHTWPNPVWGVGDAIPYKENDLKERLDKLKRAFAHHVG